MARVKFSGLVSDISGSVGGATFQRSGSVNTLRSKPIQRKPYSQAQQLQQSNMTQIQIFWSGLDSTTRKSWQTFINYSNPKTRRDLNISLTGYQLFVKYNMYRICNGLPIKELPEYLPLPVLVPTFTIDRAVGSALNITFSTPFDDSLTDFVLKCSSPRSKPLLFSKLYLRVLQHSLLDPGIYSIRSSYISNFGFEPDIGMQLNCSLVFFGIFSPVFSIEYNSIQTVLDLT